MFIPCGFIKRLGDSQIIDIENSEIEAKKKRTESKETYKAEIVKFGNEHLTGAFELNERAAKELKAKANHKLEK